MWEKRLAQAIAKKCVHSGVIQSEPVLCFGFELIITTFIGVGAIFLIAILAEKPWACIPFLLGFAPIRKYAGGYHATTHFRCHIISAVIFSMCLFASSCLDVRCEGLLIIGIINWIVILILAPISARNKPLSNQRMSKNRTMSIIIASIETVLAFGFFVLKASNGVAEIFYLGALSAAVSLVIAKIDNEFRRG